MLFFFVIKLNDYHHRHNTQQGICVVIRMKNATSCFFSTFDGRVGFSVWTFWIFFLYNHLNAISYFFLSEKITPPPHHSFCYPFHLTQRKVCTVTNQTLNTIMLLKNIACLCSAYGKCTSQCMTLYIVHPYRSLSFLRCSFLLPLSGAWVLRHGRFCLTCHQFATAGFEFMFLFSSQNFWCF